MAAVCEKFSITKDTNWSELAAKQEWKKAVEDMSPKSKTYLRNWLRSKHECTSLEVLSELGIYQMRKPAAPKPLTRSTSVMDQSQHTSDSASSSDSTSDSEHKELTDAEKAAARTAMKSEISKYVKKANIEELEALLIKLRAED